MRCGNKRKRADWCGNGRIQADTDSGERKRSDLSGHKRISAALRENERISPEIRGLIRQSAINACTKCACVPTMLAALEHDVQVLNERTCYAEFYHSSTVSGNCWSCKL